MYGYWVGVISSRFSLKIIYVIKWVAKKISLKNIWYLPGTS